MTNDQHLSSSLSSSLLFFLIFFSSSMFMFLIFTFKIGSIYLPSTMKILFPLLIAFALLFSISRIPLLSVRS
jgi:hypothetical protein